MGEMGELHTAFVATLSLPFTFAYHKPLPAVVRELIPLQRARPPEQYLADAKYNGLGDTKIHVFIEDIRTYCTYVQSNSAGSAPTLQEPDIPTFEIVFRLRLLLLQSSADGTHTVGRSPAVSPRRGPPPAPAVSRTGHIQAPPPLPPVFMSRSASNSLPPQGRSTAQARTSILTTRSATSSRAGSSANPFPRKASLQNFRSGAASPVPSTKSDGIPVSRTPSDTPTPPKSPAVIPAVRVAQPMRVVPAKIVNLQSLTSSIANSINRKKSTPPDTAPTLPAATLLRSSTGSRVAERADRPTTLARSSSIFSVRQSSLLRRPAKPERSMSDSAPKSVDAISSGSASTRSLPIPNSASPPVEPEAIPPAHPSPATTPPQTHPLQLATTLPSPTRLSRTNSNVSDVTATATDVPSELAVDSLTGHPSSQHASTTNIVGAPVTPPPSHQASATSNDPSAAATPVATTTLPPCPSATPAAEDMPTLPRLSAISTCSPELLPANRFLATPSSPNNEEKKSTAQPSDDRSSLNEEIEALVDDDGNIYLHPGKDVDMVDIAEPAISSDSDFMELYLRKSLPAPPRENKTMVSAAAGAPAIPPVPVTETMATPTLSRKSSRAVADFRQLTLTRHDMRKHIITEISATERSFYDCFNEVRVVWMDPIFDGILNQNPIMDPAEARTLFLGVDELLDHSATLRDELEEVANTQSPDASIAEVFLREQRQWKAFPRTIRNFKAAQGVIKRALATRSFAKFQQDVMRNKTTKNDTLSSLLILPVQRITRYPLLLDKLLKQTPPSHWEHALLQQAIELISRYATESNLGAREDMAHSPVMALTKPLRHVPLMVYRPSRKFITETMVREVRTDSTRRLFLFDDILLMAHCPASRGWSSMSRRTWVCDLVIDLTELSVLTQTCVEGNKHVTILSIEGGDPVSRAGSIDRRISTLSALPDPDTPFPNMVVGNAGITSTTVTLATIRSSAIGSNSPHPHLGPTSPFLLPSPPHDQTAFPFDQFQSGGLYASPVAPGASNTTAPKSPSVPASALPSAPAVPSVPATPTTPATGLTRARSDAGDSMVSRTVGKPSHSLSLVTSLSFIITPTGEKQTILPTQDPQYFTLQHTTSEAQKSFATALESQITKILLSKYVPAPFN